MPCGDCALRLKDQLALLDAWLPVGLAVGGRRCAFPPYGGGHMYEHIVRIEAQQDCDLNLWLEPWAFSFLIPAGKTVVLHAVSPVSGEIEIEVSERCTTAYSWSGSTLKVLIDGEVIEAIDIPVPEFLGRKMVTFLFEGATAPSRVQNPYNRVQNPYSPVMSAYKRKKPWWQFWK